MKEIWINSKKVAELFRVDQSLIQKKIKMGVAEFTYRYVHGCGGTGNFKRIL